MKLRVSCQTSSGLTLIELIVVVAVLVLLFVMLIPTNYNGKPKAKKINCTNNLKQIGIAYFIWAGDHGAFPQEISTTNGGTLEFIGTADSWRTYQVMSNQLNTPKILFCPADDDRYPPAKDFSAGLKGKINYFIGADARTNWPTAFLSGDDNFAIAGQPVKSGLLSLWTNDPVSWAATRHMKNGNLGPGDGSVQSSTSLGLRRYLVETEIATNHLAIP